MCVCHLVKWRGSETGVLWQVWQDTPVFNLTKWQEGIRTLRDGPLNLYHCIWKDRDEAETDGVRKSPKQEEIWQFYSSVYSEITHMDWNRHNPFMDGDQSHKPGIWEGMRFVGGWGGKRLESFTRSVQEQRFHSRRRNMPQLWTFTTDMLKIWRFLKICFDYKGVFGVKTQICDRNWRKWAKNCHTHLQYWRFRLTFMSGMKQKSYRSKRSNK